MFSRHKLLKKLKEDPAGFIYFPFWKNNLSQWSKTLFLDDEGQQFTTCEQFMMYRKARFFEDKEAVTAIMNSSDPKTIKQLGRKVRNFNQKQWDIIKYPIVLKANLLRLKHDRNFKKSLINTKDYILMETNPYDSIWGIGLDSDDDRIYNANTWNGENLLGFALMETRASIYTYI